MKNIHLFETEAAYDEAKDSLILPRVSYIKENNFVDYNPHHDYVEIAGIKWATMNVGAKSVTDYGLYFQWGDTQGYTKDEIEKEHKKAFVDNFSDYKFTSAFTKYNSNDKKTVLDLEDDAVHAAWGGSWRMPTTGDMDTVLDSTAVTKTWTSGYNGTSIAGYEFHDKNSNDTLFLPACGYALGGAVNGTGVIGDYWLSSLSTDDVSSACDLYFDSGDAYWLGDYRYGGYCVRGVLAEN